MGDGKKDLECLDRWHRNEGEYKPRRHVAPEGNLYALGRGLWADRCLNDEERKLFREVLERFWSDFELNKSSDFMQVELVAIYTVKLMRAISAADLEASERFDRLMRSHLKDLKATKITREKSTEIKKSGTSPAEWATALIEKVKAADEAERKAAKKASRKSYRKAAKKAASKNKNQLED